MPVTTCILCGSTALSKTIDLGEHPLADTFLKKEELATPEDRYPLEVLLCSECGHSMLSYIVPPQKRYQEHEYSYDSENSKVSVEHFTEMAASIARKEHLTADDLVVDIGSSVGTLLSAFKENYGARVLGIEPAPNIAALAAENHIPTLNDFWGTAAADAVLKEGGAKVITMTNAFNHIGDIGACMRDIDRALVPEGVFIVEVPYMLPLVEKLAFDTIYLEHVSYFSIRPLAQFLSSRQWVITDIEENDYMGGSIRIHMKRGSEQSPLVESYSAKEETAGLFAASTYEQMMRRIEQFKVTLLAQLHEAKNGGGKIIGIGAATKGNTLLNYCGIDTALLSFITDASPLKIGKYTPGSHIPIVSDESIDTSVTHALILPWNIAEFLKEKLGPKHPSLAFIVPHA